MSSRRFLTWALVVTAIANISATATKPSTEVFSRDNLLAWCIVPFDAKKRSPEQRAEMLHRLGFKHFAYDWRDEHLPTFDAELDALKQHNIELTAVWFPGALNADAQKILATIEKHKLTPQLWVTTSVPDNLDEDGKLAAAVDIIRPIADAAKKIGCTVGLYNHGGWFGEPENQLAIIDRLKKAGVKNVGMVYNQHHGHEHIARFERLLPRMQPHLMCLNLNGMTASGATNSERKILPIGQGELDKRLIKIVRSSGYRGRIGILNHTSEDAEARLLDNLEGLDWVVSQLDVGSSSTQSTPRPTPRTYRSATTQPTAAISDYWTVESAADREALPMYETTPAATIAELTPANGWPGDDVYKSWSRSHGNDANTRYSRLTQINRDNVKSLKLAWTYHSRDGFANIQCNPVIVDGVLYGPTVGDNIVAINATNGDEIWRFNPFPGNRPRARGRPAFRGLTWHAADNVAPRIFFADGDALWAVDAKSGKPVKSFGQGGKITITDCVVAPAVYQNVLVYAGWNGDVFGVELSSGQPLWTFHTVPHEGEEFADSWDRPEDGANCWGGMALDASRGIVYATLGSPKPNFMGASHRGDNLFGNCVIAIDVTTGKRIWHFQEVRHDIWDMEIAAPPMLVTVNATRDGKQMRVDAVAAVSKMGNTLLLDRVSGKPLFPFRRRRAPTSKIPGERTAAYQPDVELPEPLARPEFSLAEVTNISPAARSSVLTKLQESSATFGWFHPPELGKPNVHFGLHGGAEWTGSSFDPRTGLLYVSTNEIPWAITVRARPTSVDETTLPPTPGRLVYEKHCMACHGPNREGKLVNPSIMALSARTDDDAVTALLKTGRGTMPPAPAVTGDDLKNLLAYLFDRDRPASLSGAAPERPAYRFEGYPRLLDKDNYPGCKPPWGLLNAVDLNTGKIAWRVPLGEHEELTKKGVLDTGTENFGGPTVTAGGLVFCAGTRDLKIRAFDAKTGEELWSAKLPFGGFAPPSVYEANGKQYVVIAATGGGKLSVEPLPGKQPESGDAYIAFTLP